MNIRVSINEIFFALVFLILVAASDLLKAQAPQAIPYQAIARNSSGQAIAGAAVRVRFSIRDSIATGIIRYQEIHNPTTSALGLFSVNLGMGTVVSGSFAGINWGKNAKFLQVELDPAGGTAYTDLGTTQMMSVPFALNAASSNIANTAINWTPAGTGYGEVKLYNCDGLFQYLPCLPKITTIATSAIGATSANSGGNISNNGGANITASGVCWSTSQNPTIALTSKTNDAAGSGSFSSSITNLNQNTLYYVRAYATNAAGTAYGNQVNFTTATIVLPIISTTAVSAITTNSANSGGNITADGGAAITARGVCWSTSPNPTIALSTKTSNGTGSGSFNNSITNLNQNTLYYIRAYATNSAGTAYGNQVSFTTATIVLPTILTTAILVVTTNSAKSGGNITADGGGSITARGVCWSTSQNPTIALSTKTSDGTGTGSFSSSLSSLSPNTLYYVRAYATNSAGTAYGNQVSFTTSSSNPTDADGNTYTMVAIGNQVWMKENLKTNKYRNGNSIGEVSDPDQWLAIKWTGQAAWCHYENLAASNITYGKLYNWYAVADPRGLCPTGWHVPTDHDWNLLTISLDPSADTTCAGCNSSDIAGGKLKSTGTIQAGSGFWQDPNSEASNSSGFAGNPGGFRSTGMGNFEEMGISGYWWSSTQVSSGTAWFRRLYSGTGFFYRDNDYWLEKGNGLSVRCLRD